MSDNPVEKGCWHSWHRYEIVLVALLNDDLFCIFCGKNVWSVGVIRWAEMDVVTVKCLRCPRCVVFSTDGDAKNDVAVVRKEFEMDKARRVMEEFTHKAEDEW